MKKLVKQLIITCFRSKKLKLLHRDLRDAHKKYKSCLWIFIIKLQDIKIRIKNIVSSDV